MKIFPDDRIFEVVAGVADRENVEAYVIGGFVRDHIMGRVNPERDIDIVVLGDGPAMARAVAREISRDIKVTVFRTFGTATFRYRNSDIEFVGARKESYSSDSRKPSVSPGTLEDDQKRRDFTINALAISLNRDNPGEVLDPFGGIDDIRNGIIRTPLDPDATFSDDPLRMMRAVRFAAQLDFRIADKTLTSIRSNAERIKIVSAERITTELNKIMTTAKPSAGFLLLEQTGLLELILPEIARLRGVEDKDGKGHKDNFHHTLKVLDNLAEKSSDLWLRWAALLHDVAKPVTKKFVQGTGWTFHGHEFIGAKMVPEIFKRLKLPLNDRMKYVQKLVGLHLRPVSLVQDEVTDSAVRRLLFEAGEDIDDLMLLCEADITSGNRMKVLKHRENFALVRRKLKEIDEKDAIRTFQPPVDGEEIIATFNIPPGPMVGVIKSAIKEAILDGIIPNDHEAAREFMIRKGREMGLEPV
ncbi:MAG TPA: HD domain-containing protein [Bacteroidales bacterium]|jgi:poly(A) polymerase|nr:HD domain-containing protein [Bacteroidales bacterium]MDI9532543.1 HD domain-containing protein [Bacteroidota bacterium]OPZ57895.1 MAG: Multifunctional CCA protein [Bacteroidetes bacterium ADurb.BinA012]MBP8709761.1 HD domain-containing protein [Bacteroidales bacterium]MZQ79557.1 HD domain-containing protein [Bacteroidales bacterium]